MLEHVRDNSRHHTTCLGSILEREKRLNLVYIFKQVYLFCGKVRQGKYFIRKGKSKPSRAAWRRGRPGVPWPVCHSKAGRPWPAVPDYTTPCFSPIGGSHAAKGGIKTGFSLFFCPSARTYSNSSSSNSWCLSPATTFSHLLSSCCHRPSRVSQVRSQPSDGLPRALHSPSPAPHPLTSCVLVSPGLLPTPNLFQLPQQTQGALLTSQPRAGLSTQVRLPTEFVKPLAGE